MKTIKFQITEINIISYMMSNDIVNYRAAKYIKKNLINKKSRK